MLLLEAVGDSGHVHGIEPSPSMVARARKEFHSDVASGRLVLHETTMETLPFEDGELDGWISLNTIYFIPEVSRSFTELARVLAPTGRGGFGGGRPGVAQPAAVCRALIHRAPDRGRGCCVEPSRTGRGSKSRPRP